MSTSEGRALVSKTRWEFVNASGLLHGINAELKSYGEEEETHPEYESGKIVEGVMQGLAEWGKSQGLDGVFMGRLIGRLTWYDEDEVAFQ